jgi:hypothetical protein
LLKASTADLKNTPGAFQRNPTALLVPKITIPKQMLYWFGYHLEGNNITAHSLITTSKRVKESTFMLKEDYLYKVKPKQVPYFRDKEIVDMVFVKQILKEAKDWDLEPVYKHYFFKKYFSFEVLEQACFEEDDPSIFQMVFDAPILTVLMNNRWDLYEQLKLRKVQDKRLKKLLNMPIDGDQTILHISDGSDMFIIKFALDNGANPDSPNLEKQTPLMVAAGNGQREVVNTLIEYKANINALDIKNRTALHYSCLYNRPDIAKILYEYGANPALKDKDDNTPVDSCHSFNRPLFEQIFKLKQIPQPHPDPKNQIMLTKGGKLSVWNIIKPPFEKCKTCQKTFFSRQEYKLHKCPTENK